MPATSPDQLVERASSTRSSRARSRAISRRITDDRSGATSSQAPPASPRKRRTMWVARPLSARHVEVVWTESGPEPGTVRIATWKPGAWSTISYVRTTSRPRMRDRNAMRDPSRVGGSVCHSAEEIRRRQIGDAACHDIPRLQARFLVIGADDEDRGGTAAWQTPFGKADHQRRGFGHASHRQGAKPLALVE